MLMVPQDGATADDENGDVIGVVASFFKPTRPTYPDLGSNASLGDLNSLRWQEAALENSE